MALTKQTVISHIGILEDGQIQIRRSRRIFDGPEMLAEQYHRFVLAPGDDVTTQPPQLQAICQLLWTPQVIADYQAAQATRNILR